MISVADLKELIYGDKCPVCGRVRKTEWDLNTGILGSIFIHFSCPYCDETKQSFTTA